MKTKKDNKMTTNKSHPQQAAQPTALLTEGDKIWNEIKNKEVLMFAIPNQFVSQYCNPVPLDPSKCFLRYKVSAFIPALEEAIGANKDGSKYNLEVQKDLIIISRNHVIGQ
jgi:hypothetical protein